jgi:hypothetical protein
MTADAQDPKPTTPGKPTDHGSRQQKEDRQSTQTGSPELDRKSSDKGGSVKAPRPPNAK